MDLATLMFVSYRSMDERVQRAMREAGYDVTVAQSRLGQRIADEGSRLTELADRAQVTKQTASLLVAALEREGLVGSAWEPSVAGPQRRRYELTRAGSEALHDHAKELLATAGLLEAFVSRYSEFVALQPAKRGAGTTR